LRAIVSVSDKSGIVDFARGLSKLGVEIYSTGGTHKALKEARVPVKSVEELTKFPEIMDGRVKTLHPGVHGGILARRDLPQHMAQLAEKGLVTIDIVVVNLYPFVQTVAREGVSLEDAIENIDIGGPTMIRAAAKNFAHVIVVVDAADYQPILEKLSAGGLGFEERMKLAQKAYQHTATYDTAIATYLRRKEEKFPPEMTLALKKVQDLSYGENPHQQAAFYLEETTGGRRRGVAGAKQLSGKELSFNNILDLDAAMNVAFDFSLPTIAIIKHNNPCGLASHESLAQAYVRALAGDPVSAFGGIVASNRLIDISAAREIDKTHFDGIIAPGYDAEALTLLKRKRDMRIIEIADAQDAPTALDCRRVTGGFLLQTKDFVTDDEGWRVVSKRAPTAEEKRDLLFAWRAARHVKSNAIVLAKDLTLLGMGAGQPSRVDSVEIALKKAKGKSPTRVLGSDAFFPFPDGVELAAKGGVTAIIEPGGSVRDEDAIKVCNEYNVAMVFTGRRHFRH